MIFNTLRVLLSIDRKKLVAPDLGRRRLLTMLLERRCKTSIKANGRYTVG
jgi:hypothetical protein